MTDFLKTTTVADYNPARVSGEGKRLRAAGEHWHYRIGTRESMMKLGQAIFDELCPGHKTPIIAWRADKRRTRRNLGSFSRDWRGERITLHVPTLGVFLHELGHAVQRRRDVEAGTRSKPHGPQFRGALVDVRRVAACLVLNEEAPVGRLEPRVAAPAPKARVATPEIFKPRTAPPVTERDVSGAVFKAFRAEGGLQVNRFAADEGCSPKAVRRAIDKLRRKGLDIQSMGKGEFLLMKS